MKRIRDMRPPQPPLPTWTPDSPTLMGRRAVELDADGLPVDRSICPACLGQPLAGRRSCHVCEGRPVCPWCRGARYRRTVVGGMRVCPDCCDERPSRAGGLPGRERNGRREAAVIRAYREALRRATLHVVEDSDSSDPAEDADLVGTAGGRHAGGSHAGERA